jgi:DNA-binding NtrC family response regulator
MKKPTILITEGDKTLRQNLRAGLLCHGYEVIETSEKTRALRTLQGGAPDLAIIGTSRDGTWDGLKVAEQIRQQDKKLPIVLMSRQGSEARVLAALRVGVNDYFKVPFSHDELVASVKQNLTTYLERSTINKKTSGSNLNHAQPMIGQGLAMLQIKAYLSKVAETDSTVLITGETGTGKELAAESIHRNSARHKKPFVCINCAALPESLVESELFGYDKGAFTGALTSKQGKFERAEGGTVFLDEIGDMSSCAQVKILRTIEKKEVYHLGGKRCIPLDVRVIAATNQEPEGLVQEGRFRKDLYYRLNVARIHLPPLRDRKEDILPIIDCYIQEFNHRFGREVEGFSEEALEFLLNYDWPGNIRELKNLLEAIFINLSSKKIVFIDLPKPFQKRLKEMEGFPKSERDQMLSALFATNWNKSKAAQKLNWSRMTLYRKMAKYHIKVPEGLRIED